MHQGTAFISGHWASGTLMNIFGPKVPSPELLKAAINAEGDDPFWMLMREWVGSGARPTLTIQ
jgi:hypothetical protein